MNRMNIRAGGAVASGFTLVELMVVVLIISILAAIAVPGYRAQVVKTQRAAAKACLAQYAQFMERYYTTHLNYKNADPGDLACAVEDNMERHYTFTLTGVTESKYTVNAVPTASFARRDRDCGTLKLDQAGVKGVSSGSVDVCW